MTIKKAFLVKSAHEIVRDSRKRPLRYEVSLAECRNDTSMRS